MGIQVIKMRKTKALSLALGGLLLLSSLVLLASPVLADSGNGNGHGNGPWSEDGGMNPADQGNGDEMYQKGVDRSLMGKMNYSYGYGQGGFVFYTLNEDTGEISDYGLFTSEGERVLIASILIEGFVPESVEARGSIVVMEEGNLTAVIHDNPTGMFHLFVDEPANVTLVLAGEMMVVESKVLNESSDLSYQLRISDGVSSGMVASDDPFEVSVDGTVIACNVTEHLMVRFLPQVQHRHQWMEQVLMEAVQNGRVAAEVSLVGGQEGGIFDTVSYRSELQVQVQQVIRNRFQLQAQGQNGQGALLLIHTEAGTMDMSQDRLRVRLNDRDMSCVPDPLQLLYGQPDEACYTVIDDGEVQQMLVYLPADTLGTVTVEGLDAMSELLSPVGIAMMVGAVGLVALAGIAVFRKR